MIKHRESTLNQPPSCPRNGDHLWDDAMAGVLHGTDAQVQGQEKGCTDKGSRLEWGPSRALCQVIPVTVQPSHGEERQVCGGYHTGPKVC